MPMREDWVEALHARLIAAYGVRFMAQYGELPAALVRASWATELDGITSRGIAYALQHLSPDYPPNALQFRALCRSAPSSASPYKALEGPAVTPASVQRLAQAVAPLTKPKDPKAWAYALKAREEGGERLSPALRTMWRAAVTFHGRTSNPSNGAASSSIEPDSLLTPLP